MNTAPPILTEVVSDTSKSSGSMSDPRLFKVFAIFYFYLQNNTVILQIGPIPDLEEPVWSIT